MTTTSEVEIQSISNMLEADTKNTKIDVSEFLQELSPPQGAPYSTCDEFQHRHIGLLPKGDSSVVNGMLVSIGYASMSSFVKAVVPESIYSSDPVAIDQAVSEVDALAELKKIANKNSVYRSLIGQGYYDTHTPEVLKRNILENPAWYTAYTPYQPEISQGRLEALLNFQTMVCDLTAMDIANASMLDEGSAAAEAMALAKRVSKNKSNTFFVDSDCFPQTIEVVKTRAQAAGYDLVIGDAIVEFDEGQHFGVLLQYPCASGEVHNYQTLVAQAHAKHSIVVMAADILALTLLQPPGEIGADVVVGNTQRFGVPMGFGGPHAAYMATNKKYQRSMPGRLVGVSIDKAGNPAYRLALQTREQHIRREKATSNICTAQVLLAVMASMYACYHGPQRLRDIARRVKTIADVFASGITSLGFSVVNQRNFDTLTIATGTATNTIHQRARDAKINLRYVSESVVGLSFDEASTTDELSLLWKIFSPSSIPPDAMLLMDSRVSKADDFPYRASEFLSHPVFSRYQSETEMMRYLRRLSDKDLALDRAMIPLGSCTMKLNAASEMAPITWPEFAKIHPFAPEEQSVGYRQMIAELESMLAACTGYDAVSLQPNAGSQGEFAGLLAIAAYHQSRGEAHRNVCLIPQSAHGTNPASAQMCSMRVVVVDCDESGNIDVDDLEQKASANAEHLAAIMVTYPSTHGVFEEQIVTVTDIVHRYGGQVYLDGANLNAMVGLCAPGKFGGDISHLNLHKTFCIPHGGGGPGVGPVAAKSHLAPFLPARVLASGTEVLQSPVISSAAFGSAGIFPISWMYIRMMGANGLRHATEAAILSANYVAAQLSGHYPVLYTGDNGLVAHECIIDLRPLKDTSGIAVEDVAKRLIDYGFHAPTMSFPVAGTLMIEPTESESQAELDRFCQAMIAIRQEIQRVESGEWPLEDNPLVNAPHTAEQLMSSEWRHGYTREEAAYPLDSLRQNKYFSPVARVDNVYGDRNLQCACPSVDDYR